MTRAADRAYATIRARILAGTYAPGAHLKEEQLADDTGVSRTPVREALRRLSAEHLVKFVSNRGAYVAHWSPSDVDDIFQLRLMLEGYAAWRAAPHISAEQIAILEHCAAAIEELTSGYSADKHMRMLEHNQRFHTTIVEAAASERLKVLLSWLVEVPMLLRTYEKFDEAELRRSNHHHRELISAFEHRDPEWARLVMQTHIRAAHRVYLSKNGRTATGPAAAPGPASGLSVVG